MLVSLTIIRYRKIFIPFAFLAMAVFRLPLFFNGKLSFYKLMGSGKNGSFDKVPDLQQWAIITVSHNDWGLNEKEIAVSGEPVILKAILGNFISKWFRFFKTETYTLLLKPMESHGCWDGKELFKHMPVSNADEGPVAVLTRATIRLSKLKYFWQNVAPVTAKMNDANGLLFSAGIGEIPWIKQATFSVWQTKADMKSFAYGLKEHKAVIQKTRKQRWYKEEMFTRFKILRTSGLLNADDPLKSLNINQHK